MEGGRREFEGELEGGEFLAAVLALDVGGGARRRGVDCPGHGWKEDVCVCARVWCKSVSRRGVGQSSDRDIEPLIIQRTTRLSRKSRSIVRTVSRRGKKKEKKKRRKEK